MPEEYLSGEYDPSQFEKPSVTVDAVLFTIRDGCLQVLLTRRAEAPFKGMLALPGTFVGIDEPLDEAAARALRTKAGLEGVYLEQLYTWGDPHRDPRMRILSVSYYALVPESRLSDLAEGTALFPVEAIGEQTLAFDHAEIIRYGRERIRGKTTYTDIAFSLLGEEFTLPELQSVYEILLGQKLYKANFRKKIAEKLVETDKMTSGDAHRPSRIYRKKAEGGS